MTRLLTLALVGVFLLAPTYAVGQTPTAPFSGSGARVVKRYFSPAQYVIAASHDGGSNFIVSIHDPNGGETLLFNEIGRYSGQAVFTVSDRGIHLVEIEANGGWTIDIEGDER